MKKIIFIFILILTVFLLSCEAEDETELEDITEAAESHTELVTEPETFIYDLPEKVKQYIIENTLDTIPNGFREFSCIAAIPEKDIYLYGYNNGGSLLLKYQNKYEIFNYYWLTPRRVLPEVYLYDYDGDGEKELAVKLYQASGTGVSMWSLLMVEVNEEAEQYEDIFYGFKYSMLGYDKIHKMISDHIEKTEEYMENDKYLLDIYADGVKYTVDITEIKELYCNERESVGICLSEINRVDIENRIIVHLPIGYICGNMAFPVYMTEESAVYAEITYNNGKFQVNKTWVDKGTYF